MKEEEQNNIIDEVTQGDYKYGFVTDIVMIPGFGTPIPTILKSSFQLIPALNSFATGVFLTTRASGSCAGSLSGAFLSFTNAIRSNKYCPSSSAFKVFIQ